MHSSQCLPACLLRVDLLLIDRSNTNNITFKIQEDFNVDCRCCVVCVLWIDNSGSPLPHSPTTRTRPTRTHLQPHTTVVHPWHIIPMALFIQRILFQIKLILHHILRSHRRTTVNAIDGAKVEAIHPNIIQSICLFIVQTFATTATRNHIRCLPRTTFSISPPTHRRNSSRLPWPCPSHNGGYSLKHTPPLSNSAVFTQLPPLIPHLIFTADRLII